MATYVMGDLHGCFDTLRALWRRLPFDVSTDRLWLAGDLANRGPGSLETLRWARGMADRLGPRFAAVLGNHDLILLRRAAGLRPPKPRDTLEPILEASDGDELIDWVAELPLLHWGTVETGVQDWVRDWVLVHAGLWPDWSPETAARRARQAESWLRDPRRRPRLLNLPAAETAPPCSVDRPEETAAAALARHSLFAFTELRTLRRDGRACDDFSGHPEEAPAGCLPWFRHPARGYAWPKSVHVAFGHWAALGYHRGGGVLALDTGVIWGGGLTAVRLDDGAVYFQETLEPISSLPRAPAG